MESSKSPSLLKSKPNPVHSTNPSWLRLSRHLRIILYLTMARVIISFDNSLIFSQSSLSAIIASRLLPHIEGGRAFLCTSAVLLNISAAISTVTLTAMGMELDFRLSRMQGLGRIPRLLYLNCASSLAFNHGTAELKPFCLSRFRDGLYIRGYSLSDHCAHII